MRVRPKARSDQQMPACNMATFGRPKSKVINELNAISPIDGRYRKGTEILADHFSELALMKYRVMVEVEYFIALCELPLPQLAEADIDKKSLRSIYHGFGNAEAQRIKDTEKVTNHDVKAVEYFVKDRLKDFGLEEYVEFVHFGLTSQDINNTALPLSLRDSMDTVFWPKFSEIVERLAAMAKEWAHVPMLARTHGQPASPTVLGKEIQVFVERLRDQEKLLKAVPFSAKFGGATGNFNAHSVAYPDIDWVKFSNELLRDKLELVRSQFTTQIDHYDNMAAVFDSIKRINNILIDLDRDLWTYISMDHFKQKIKAGEVGSSAMPHKVNPIDFENSEGNLGIANALFEHLAAKLPISRLQRDLTDSTVTRNIGVPMGHTLIGFNSLLKGLGKLILNEDSLRRELENNWEVVAEGIQTILRSAGFPQPYEALKALTRNNTKVGAAEIAAFIDGLDVPDDIKVRLKAITPWNYTGLDLMASV